MQSIKQFQQEEIQLAGLSEVSWNHFRAYFNAVKNKSLLTMIEKRMLSKQITVIGKQQAIKTEEKKGEEPKQENQENPEAVSTNQLTANNNNSAPNIFPESNNLATPILENSVSNSSSSSNNNNCKNKNS